MNFFEKVDEVLSIELNEIQKEKESKENLDEGMGEYIKSLFSGKVEREIYKLRKRYIEKPSKDPVESLFQYYTALERLYVKYDDPSDKFIIEGYMKAVMETAKELRQKRSDMIMKAKKVGFGSRGRDEEGKLSIDKLKKDFFGGDDERGGFGSNKD